MKKLICLLLLTTSVHAQENLQELKKQLDASKSSGAYVALAGVDPIKALSILTDKLIELENKTKQRTLQKP